MSVYLDHNATTPVHRRALEGASHWLQRWGNPSSIHWAGRDSKLVLRETRQLLAQYLGCQSLDIVFTSGGSEGNNTILKAVWNQRSKERDHFLVSSVEHPSVMRTMDYLKTLGAKVDLIPVNREGEIDLQFIAEKLSHRTALVSVMMANNETGNIFPIKEIAAMAHAHGALMHSDCVQALGKLPVNLKEMDVDYASFSAHKFYALKGCGFIFLRRHAPYESLIHGGGQERHRRGGTENIPGIAALKEVLPLLAEADEQNQKVQDLRRHLESRITQEISGVRITGAGGKRLGNTSSLVLQDVDGETLLMSLDLKGFAVSTGAACSSGSPEPSPVLLAMGLSREEAQASLRVSLGWENTFEEVDAFVDVLKQVVQRLRNLKASREAVTHV